MHNLLAVLTVSLLLVASANAQHVAPSDTTHREMPAEAMHSGAADHALSGASTLLPTVPMQRDGSGTAWLPDATPMYAAHGRRGAWAFMTHGLAFLRYTAQDAFESGDRGDRSFSAPNWLMGMAQRPMGASGQLTARGMISLDPLTEGGSGYPLLFQTGETYDDEPLIDRQHPHDLFPELSLTYGYAFSDEVGTFAYAGYPGEPALGPVAFMHRPSARHNPEAPLGHHWQDATHILFGVVTAGLRLGPLKLDGSVFTGREPGENRYDFDRPRFDSYSARLAAHPTDRWALQVSRGWIESPEVLTPEIDKQRTTASATYHRPLGGDSFWASTLVWGLNEPQRNESEDAHAHEETHAHDEAEHSFLAESDLQLGPHALYVRAEWVEKASAELGLAALDEETYGVGALTLGLARTLWNTGGLLVDLGAQGTLYRVPDDLQPAYGARPVSLGVFLRLSPSRMATHGSGGERHSVPTM